MYPSGWIEVAVTDWMDDDDEKFLASDGEKTNLEWLQEEKNRIARVARFSRPFIRFHPKYFDKDSHGRRRHKLIALHRFICPTEIEKAAGGGAKTALTFMRREHFAASDPDAQTAICAAS